MLGLCEDELFFLITFESKICFYSLFQIDILVSLFVIMMYLFQVRYGYLQVDNCIMEDGMVFVQNPGSVVMSFCTFRHATVILQHVNASIIQNCEFSQTDSAAITVEGYPKEDKNWTYRSLNHKIMSLCTLQKKPDGPKYGDIKIPKSAFSTVISLSTATTHPKQTAKHHGVRRRMSGDTIRRKFSQDIGLHDGEGHSCNMSVQSQGAVNMSDVQSLPQRQFFCSASDSHHSNMTRENMKEMRKGNSELGFMGDSSAGTFDGTYDHTDGTKDGLSTQNKNTFNDGNARSVLENNQEKYKRIESFVSDCAKYGHPGTSGECTVEDGDGNVELPRSFFEQPKLMEEDDLHEILNANEKTADRDDNCESNSDLENARAKVPALDLHSFHSRDEAMQHNEHVDFVQRERSLSSSDVSLHTASSNDVSDEEEDGDASYNSGQ